MLAGVPVTRAAANEADRPHRGKVDLEMAG